MAKAKFEKCYIRAHIMVELPEGRKQIRPEGAENIRFWADAKSIVPVDELVGVVHARWVEIEVKVPHYVIDRGTGAIYTERRMAKRLVCSNCKKIDPKNSRDFSYCPHCSAKMDLKEEE